MFVNKKLLGFIVASLIALLISLILTLALASYNAGRISTLEHELETIKSDLAFEKVNLMRGV